MQSSSSTTEITIRRTASSSEPMKRIRPRDARFVLEHTWVLDPGAPPGRRIVKQSYLNGRPLPAGGWWPLHKAKRFRLGA